ncbi:mitotic checkpoint protein BUB3.3 isoform X2 [Benincasa hispida]|uniref:mitotic checkpoint protein BUB3.3 isoform X2 n=1 Tax=Benincasa hispida TaxID=102211 RepID=UPI0019015305|nr:mitotic checkpoint protein BUB3.3 isoform X2 [Benincasa hispida]
MVWARSLGMESNRVLLNFEIPIQDSISKLEFAPHSNNLLISSWDSILRLYDVDKSILRLEASSEAALLDCCFQDESLAFSAGSDGCIRSYELQSGIVETVGKHDDSVTHIRYSDRTCQIVTAGLDGKIQLWDTRKEKSLSFVRNMGSDVVSMSLSGFNLNVASRACVYLLDLRNLEKSIQLKDSYMKVPVACVSSVPYSEGVAVGSVDGCVALDITCLDQTDDIRYIFRCHPKSKAGRNHLESVNDIVFNPIHHGAFATGDNTGFVSIWDFQRKRRILELPRFPNSVASLSYNCTGELLAVASSCTYQEAKEREDPPQVFLHNVMDSSTG